MYKKPVKTSLKLGGKQKKEATAHSEDETSSKQKIKDLEDYSFVDDANLPDIGKDVPKRKRADTAPASQKKPKMQKPKQNPPRIEDPPMPIAQKSKYAMEIRTNASHGGVIKKIIENVSPLLKNLTIQFTKDLGICIAAVDNAKYCFVAVQLDKSQFLYYHCPGTFKITLDINTFNHALTMNGYEVISFVFLNSKSKNLHIMMHTEDDHGRIVQFKDQELYCITEERDKQIKVPTTTMEDPMVFSADVLQSNFRNASYYGAVVQIAVSKNKKNFYIISTGGDLGSSYVTLRPGRNYDDDDKPFAAEDEEQQEDENADADKALDEASDKYLAEHPRTEEQMQDTLQQFIADDDDENAGNSNSQANAEEEDVAIDSPSASKSEDTSSQLDLTDCESALFLLRFFITFMRFANVAKEVQLKIIPNKMAIFNFPITTHGNVMIYVVSCSLNQQQ